MSTASKIVDLDKASEIRAQLKNQGKKVVFTNGCFALLHLGHVDYLEKARSLGDFMMVGLNSDTSVSNIKGPDRPIADQLSRSRVIAALSFVDAVVIFDDETPQKLISALLPDILVKGDDYSIDQIIGAPEVIEAGGEVKMISLVQGYSTSKLISRIVNSH